MMRDEILQFFREYYDAGHIVGINADVLGHKLADRIGWDAVNKDTDTPRTDRAKRFYVADVDGKDAQWEYVPIEFARQIEIENRQLTLKIAIVEEKINSTFSALTNEQLKDAISITHNMMLSTAPSSPRYEEICQHFTELMGIQKARAES